MANLKIREAILTLGAATLILLSPFSNQEITYAEQYSINENFKEPSATIPFGSCSYGDVYIIKDESQINENIENAIFVIDERYDEDPNMRIHKSYTIKHEKGMSEIICILQQYEMMYPTTWERTYSSMLNEWEVHNICSNNYYKRARTDHVDFNNKDEDTYSLQGLKKILINKK